MAKHTMTKLAMALMMVLWLFNVVNANAPPPLNQQIVAPKTSDVDLEESKLFGRTPIGTLPKPVDKIFEEVYSECNPNKFNSSTVWPTLLPKAMLTLEEYAKKYYPSYVFHERGLTAYFQCRDDLDDVACHTCVNSAIQQVGLDCKDAMGARAQLRGCLVRYETCPFNNEERDYNVIMSSCSSTTNDQILNNQDDIQKLIDNVNYNARKRYPYHAEGSYKVGDQTIYALAECTNYLTRDECFDCLDSIKYNWKNTCKPGAIGGEVHTPNCYYRFENFKFYFYKVY